MKTTPLYDLHEELGAKMVDFEGWSMPLQYRGILPEHHHTRQTSSLFDTCHMTEYEIQGASSSADLAQALGCRVGSLDDGQCRYGFLLNQSGGVIDDLICYRIADNNYMVVANAGTHQQVFQVLEERLSPKTNLTDISEETAKVDVQGPTSAEVLRDTWGFDPAQLGYYEFTQTQLGDTSAIVSRTGYTGELGFELYLSHQEVIPLCEKLLEHDALLPAGLGARDTLRLEMGYPLYGHELDESTTPVEAGLAGFLPPEESYFGHDPIQRQQNEGGDVQRIGIQFEGRRAARPGDDILLDGAQVGCISSGAFAPSLKCAIAQGYVKSHADTPGQTVEASVRSHTINGTVTEFPFYREGSAQVNLEGE